MAQNSPFVSLLWTLISQAWNGLLRHFQCLKSSAGNSLAVEKGPRSIAPQGAELWLFKEGYRLLNFSKMWSGVLQKFKNLEPSEWSALAMEQAPRTVAPLEGKLQQDRVGKCHSIFTNFGKMTISRAWNGLFQKFKKLKSLVWSALAFGK